MATAHCHYGGVDAEHTTHSHPGHTDTHLSSQLVECTHADPANAEPANASVDMSKVGIPLQETSPKTHPPRSLDVNGTEVTATPTTLMDTSAQTSTYPGMAHILNDSVMNVLTDLTFVGSIKVGDKISLKDRTVVSKDSWYGAWSRYRSSDSRASTLEGLVQMCERIENMYAELSLPLVSELAQHVPTACCGLERLGRTYDTDNAFCLKLADILDRLRGLHRRLQYQCECLRYPNGVVPTSTTNTTTITHTSNIHYVDVNTMADSINPFAVVTTTDTPTADDTVTITDTITGAPVVITPVPCVSQDVDETDTTPTSATENASDMSAVPVHTPINDGTSTDVSNINVAQVAVGDVILSADDTNVDTNDGADSVADGGDSDSDNDDSNEDDHEDDSDEDDSDEDEDLEDPRLRVYQRYQAQAQAQAQTTTSTAPTALSSTPELVGADMTVALTPATASTTASTTCTKTVPNKKKV